MNEACQIAYSQNSVIDLDKAGQLFGRLKGWYNSCQVLSSQHQLYYLGTYDSSTTTDSIGCVRCSADIVGSIYYFTSC